MLLQLMLEVPRIVEIIEVTTTAGDLVSMIGLGNTSVAQTYTAALALGLLEMSGHGCFDVFLLG